MSLSDLGNPRVERKISRPLAQFFAWWLGELDALWEEIRSFGETRHVVARVDEGCIELRVEEQGEVQRRVSLDPESLPNENEIKIAALGAPSSSRKSVLLEFSDGLALRQVIALPRGITDVIEPVIKNQVERLVPWPADESWFGYKLQQGGGETGNIIADIAALREKNIRPAIDRIADLGWEVDRVELVDSNDPSNRLELKKGQHLQIEKRTTRTAQILRWLAAILLIAGMAGIGQILQLQGKLDVAKAGLAGINAEFSRSGRTLSANEALRRQWQMIMEKRKGAPSIARAINALTAILPDDTRLTALELSGDSIIIKGWSENATPLISALEASSYFKDVKFYAPTTRLTGRSEEEFAVKLDLVQDREMEEKG